MQGTPAKRKILLSNDKYGFIFHKEWKLYAPKDLMDNIDKGVTYHDAF